MPKAAAIMSEGKPWFIVGKQHHVGFVSTLRACFNCWERLLLMLADDLLLCYALLCSSSSSQPPHWRRSLALAQLTS